MKKLDEFLRLSHYLKSYELYKTFSIVEESSRRAKVDIDEVIKNKDMLKSKEKDLLIEYNKTLKKIENNNRVLEESFNNYDFSKLELEQAQIDYKVLTYEFFNDTMMQLLEGKYFVDKKDIVNYANAARKVVLRYFIEKFYLTEEIETLMDKAFEKLLIKVLELGACKKEEEDTGGGPDVADSYSEVYK